MNILYGVSGEGSIHSSRALVIAKHLEEKGHKIYILTYGESYNILKDKFKVMNVIGLHQIFKKNVLKKRSSIDQNIKNFSYNLLKLKKFDKLMKDFKPDLCITDYEPIVPILSFGYKKTLISIDNQHRITNLEIEIPVKYQKDFIIARDITNAVVKDAHDFIISSFIKNNVVITRKNTKVANPIIKNSIKQLKPNYYDYLLVYLNKKDNHIIKLLKNIPENFVIYGYDTVKKIDNLEFKKNISFLRDFENCKAIIAIPDFTLIAEAVYLKKPYLAVPLKGNFEHILNSLFLKKAGFGEFTEDIKNREIIYFLNHMNVYKNNLLQNKYDNEEFFKELDKIINKYYKKKS